jgi:hypothetical protein
VVLADNYVLLDKSALQLDLTAAEIATTFAINVLSP